MRTTSGKILPGRGAGVATHRIVELGQLLHGDRHTASTVTEKRGKNGAISRHRRRDSRIQGQAQREGGRKVSGDGSRGGNLPPETLVPGKLGAEYDVLLHPSRLTNHGDNPEGPPAGLGELFGQKMSFGLGGPGRNLRKLIAGTIAWPRGSWKPIPARRSLGGSRSRRGVARSVAKALVR